MKTWQTMKTWQKVVFPIITLSTLAIAILLFVPLWYVGPWKPGAMQKKSFEFELPDECEIIERKPEGGLPEVWVISRDTPKLLRVVNAKGIAWWSIKEGSADRGFETFNHPNLLFYEIKSISFSYEKGAGFAHCSYQREWGSSIIFTILYGIASLGVVIMPFIYTWGGKRW